MPSFKLPLPRLSACVSAALLAGCNGVTIGGVDNSSGGGNPVLGGTYTVFNASTHGNDQIVGAVDSVGNGFAAEFGPTLRAIYAFNSASQSGMLNGGYAAYAANGSNLGDGSTLRQGALSGTVATQNSVTTASITLTGLPTPAATVVLDHPPLTQPTLANIAGTYRVVTGSATMTSSALSTSGSATYTITVDVAGTFTLTSDAGCNLSNGTASLDSTFDALALHVTGTCSATGLSLDGVAVFLRAGTPSPLGGGNLAFDSLLLELSDFIVNTSSPRYALALLAGKAQT